MFKGSMVALVTPYANGELDYKTLDALVDFHIEAGTDVIVPCGTTGESPTLTHAENDQVVAAVVKRAKGKIAILAGTGSNSTAEALQMTRNARRNGADGSLLVVPYYNKPPQEGIYRHFKTIAQSVELPVILYNIPGRSVINMTAETTLRLANDVDNIVAVKEASGNMGQIATVLNEVPADFIVLSGDDAVTIPVAALGGRGVISTAGNEIPGEMTAIAQACLRNDFPAARAIQAKFLPLMNINFVESNPIPVKAAMALMGLLDPVWRLPMVPPSQANLAKIESVLQSVGLLVHQ